MDSEEMQGSIFDRALAKFDERNEVRRDLWAEFDEADALHHARSKVARLQAMIKTPPWSDGLDDEAISLVRPELREEFVDDALDLINYAAFAIRHAEGLK